MDIEVLFRAVFGALAATLLAIRMAYQRRPPRTQKAEGITEHAMLPIFIGWTISLALYVFGFTRSHLSTFIPVWARWSGVFFMALSLPLSVWTYRTLGKHFLPTLQLLENHTLITGGPYRFVRHPMYAIFLLCSFASIIASANLMIAVAGATAAAWLLLRIKREERMLLAYFGMQYHKYMDHTGAIVPKLHPLTKK